MRELIYAGFAASLLLAGCNAPAEQSSEEAPEETAALPERDSTMNAVVSVEGEDSTVTMDLVEGSDAMYSLYIDPGRYTFETGEKEDRLAPVEQAPEDYPEVFMTFLYVDNQTPESVAEDMEQEYSMPFEKETISSPQHALTLHGTSGEQADSEVVTLYMIEAEGGTLLITEKYFLEAQEGHGVRFEQMLDTLEVRK